MTQSAVHGMCHVNRSTIPLMSADGGPAVPETRVAGRLQTRFSSTYAEVPQSGFTWSLDRARRSAAGIGAQWVLGNQRTGTRGCGGRSAAPGPSVCQPARRGRSFDEAVLAEREGFEPSVGFPLHTLSKRAPSTTRTSLRIWNQQVASGLTVIIAHAGGVEVFSSIMSLFNGLERAEDVRRQDRVRHQANAKAAITRSSLTARARSPASHHAPG